MSPSRPASSRRNSSGSFKPYTRGSAPVMAMSMSDPPRDLRSSSGSSNSSAGPNIMLPGDTSAAVMLAGNNTQPIPAERPGFPTYAQYKQVESTYIHSLTPRRQGKALISQSLFDRIWDVLHQPESQGETAQFRFWARKMFTLSKTHRSTLGGVTAHPDEPPQEVLLHDNLLVAIQEQLYDLLCYCHGSTGHGGRDKTCALIRKHYTWVPKDLVSNFIKACPTCIMKKCGTIDSGTIASHMLENRAAEATFAHMPECFQNYGPGPDGPVDSPDGAAQAAAGSSVPWPVLGGPRDFPVPPHMSADPLEAAYREAVLRARGLKASLASPDPRSLQGVPMSREVSLYKGLPNGWQYRHTDYAAAHAEFMKMKDSTVVQDGDLGVRTQRPRVPSILPLWGPEQFSQNGFQEIQDADIGEQTSMPSYEHLQAQAEHAHALSMQYLLVAQQQQQQQAEKDMKEELDQIDPILMQLSAGSSSETGIVDGSSEPNQPISKLATSMSLRRLGPNPRLHLDLSPGRVAFQSHMAYREAVDEGNLSPDSPLMTMTWPPSNKPSPTSSESSSRSYSGSSQLSAFAMPPPMSAATSMSPPSSALTTPVDECGGTNSDVGGKGLGVSMSMIKGKMRMVSGPELGEVELSEGIQQVCGL